MRYCNVGGYPTCEFERKGEGKRDGWLRESRLNDRWVVLNLNERENETDKRGGKHDAKPVALVALPGETLGCLLLSVLRTGFYIILNT